MKKIASILFSVLVIGLLIILIQTITGFSLFNGDWLVGPIIIIVCFVAAIVLLIYYLAKIYVQGNGTQNGKTGAE